MTFVTDIADDLDVMDDLEVVTFTPVNPDGADIPNVTAQRSALTAAQLSAVADVVDVSPSDVRFLLAANDLGGTQVTIQSVIKDSDGINYTVLWVDKILFGTRWRCHCRREVS